MSPHESLGAPPPPPPQLRDGESRPALAMQTGGHGCLGPRVWGRESGRLFPPAHALYTTHTFLAHPVPLPQNQCLLLPSHKILSASSLFPGLASTSASHLHTQLARKSICCRGRGWGGKGDPRGPLLTRVSSPLPRSSQGFMHMKLSRTKEHKYVLGQNSPPFSSVPEIVHHYASRKLPIKGAEHMSLLYPVAIRTL